MTPKSNLCIDVPDYVPTPDAIMNLFVTDEVVLRASEIMRRTGRREDTVRKSLWRLVKEGKLFRIGLCQYGRVATAKPIAKMRGERIAALERRLDEMATRLDHLASRIEERAARIGGPAHAAMLEVAEAIREAGAR